MAVLFGIESEQHFLAFNFCLYVVQIWLKVFIYIQLIIVFLFIVEQYDAFVKFNYDQVQRRFQETAPTCKCHNGTINAFFHLRLFLPMLSCLRSKYCYFKQLCNTFHTDDVMKVKSLPVSLV